jgi:tRNA nucleotidyltransferase (CCA-adding enzyme)
MKINLESPYSEIFQNIGSRLGPDSFFLVGGFVRDTLLGRKSDDLDIACLLSPAKVKKVFPEALCFEKYGTFTFRRNQIHVTIACMREEGEYVDFRHPSHVKFVSDLHIDYKRRDFTINSLYVDKNLEIIDPTERGVSDLRHHLITLIGDKKKRLYEDPLRILRAYRFSYDLDFDIEEETRLALSQSLGLLNHLNKEKVKEELRKMKPSTRDIIIHELHLDFVI